ncbi:hypothetical protein Tco_0972536 [Tanacetum coccineum]
MDISAGLRGLSQSVCFLYPTQKLIQPDGSSNVRFSTPQPYVVGEIHELSTSCSSQNTKLLPNSYGSEMQSQPGVRNIRARLHSDLDVFQKYSNLCVGNVAPQYTTFVKGIGNGAYVSFLIVY